MHLYEVLLRPILTEKSNYAADQLRHYTFEVDSRANKMQVRDAVVRAFDVEVVGVNIMNVRGKRRRWGRHYGKLANWKKAVVTLAPGETISLFEGV